MHTLVVTFNLKNMSDAEFRAFCDEAAPTFAAVPGLLTKVWLADPATNTYGGVYTWRDKQAMVDFTKTDLFKSVATHPNLDGITSTDFAVMEGPTRVTRGLIQAAA